MNFSESDSLSCACCGDALHTMFDRRRVLRGIGAAGLLAVTPSLALAAPKYKFEAMVLSCIDPRFQKPVFKYMTQTRGLKGQYSKFTIAGAAIGVVAPAFEKWHQAFWDNLAASVQLHSITKVIAIDHRDCGAAKIAYGKDKLANPEIETTTHREAMAEFRKQVAAKQPNLAVETFLMAKDGSVEAFS
jgi:carbonic anhydrase